MVSRGLWLAAGAAFLAMLDTSIANLAFPDLGREFGAHVNGLTWIVTLYVVLFAAVLAPSGRLADVAGPRRLYRIGTGLFAVASLACALAPDLAWLLAARALQGAGAGAMIPASLAVLLHGTPAEGRARAIGLWSAAGAVAAAIGPSVGGLMVDALGWRSLFLINVPVAVALVYGARGLTRGTKAAGRLPDLLGTVLLGLGLGLLALGVSEGSEWGWTDPRTAAVLVAGAAATVLALVRSARHPVPALDVSLWRVPAFTAASVVSFLYGLAFFPWMLVGVLVLTGLWGYDALDAGLAMTPGAVTAAVGAIVLSRRATPRTAIVLGGVLMGASAAWIWLALTPEPAFLTFWLPCGLLVGVGMGALATGVSGASALSAGPERFAAATGLTTTARQFGGALGVAVLAALLAADAPGLDAFLSVYLFCGVTAALAGAAGLAVPARHMSAPTSEGAPA
ncbi:DHA2 family efflux MFS transporter permease subunit [Actinocorallia sp. A-T 12471]|uniref:DHA2 family efflux MFS transporter permease subunit n=1 Tax=Actinocorallia sp. A-T 12471 TaxID=3089813 RepID=UPI0029D39FEC|nr:DHA2 family efflux MFS transporter permease subunit [Actinocorallia sp. A-T 12471]MDX6744846.1 DHA2 family efflux MFS transporter permease subunit [Actinocorallia sp. A-T 12471]